MVNWAYNNQPILSHEDLEPACTDFVYLLTFESGKQYIGKKRVRSMRRLKPTKAQLAIRKNYVRKEFKNLPFVKYEGSSKENDNEVVTHKQILYQCSTKIAATFLEVKLMIEHDVLATDMYTNACIAGTYWSNVMDGVIQITKYNNEIHT